MNNEENNKTVFQEEMCVKFGMEAKARDCVEFTEKGKARACTEFKSGVPYAYAKRGEKEPQQKDQLTPPNKEKGVLVLTKDQPLCKGIYPMQPKDKSLIYPTDFYNPLSDLTADTIAKIVEECSAGQVDVYTEDEKPYIASYGKRKLNPTCLETPVSCITEVSDKGFQKIAPDFGMKHGCTYYIANEEKPVLLFRGEVKCSQVRICIDREGDIVSEEWCIGIRAGKEDDFDNKWVKNVEAAKTIIKRMRSKSGITIEKGAESYIHNLISLLAYKVEASTIYIDAGWQLIDGKYRFLYDGRKGKIRVNCGKRIPKLEGIDCCNIFRKASRIFNDQTLAGPMILYSMYGIMYLLFTEAGYRPTMILFVSGHSGTLKTSTAKILYRMWNTDTDEEIMSFQSTAAAIEPVIKDCYDSVFLIDDYCVNAVQGTGMKRDMAKNLDIFLRYYGDGISKKKSNLSGELISAPRPRGGAVVTGEICASGESSLLRTLTIKIPEGGINGEALAVFQKYKNMWATFLGEFISFVEKNFELIVAMIRSSYEEMRKNAKNQFAAKRSVDHWAEMCLINDVLRKFLISQGMRTEEVDSIGEIFIQGVKSWIKSSEQIAQKEDPKKILLEAILEATDSCLKIAPSRQDFKQRIGFDGYYDTDGKARISKKKFVESVNRTLAIYSQSVDRLGLSWKGIPKMLHEEYGIISIFQNGGKNRCYTSDIIFADGHKENAYVMNADLLREIVESNE